jgi:outer membrane protein
MNTPLNKSVTLRAVLLVALLCGGAPASAQMKVGFVSVNKILDDAPQAQAASKRIEREFAPRDRSIIAQQKELRAMEDKLVKNAAVMSATERQRQESEIRALRREIRRLRDEFQEDLNLRRSQELSKLQRKVVEVIRKLAESENYDLIVGDGVIYAGKRVDITDKVIQRLGSGK